MKRRLRAHQIFGLRFRTRRGPVDQQFAWVFVAEPSLIVNDDELLRGSKRADQQSYWMTSFGAFIGETAIPRLGFLQIEEVDCGYRICGRIREDKEKLEILRSLGRIRRGQVQRAKFVTKTGALVNATFEVAESRFDEEALPDSRLLEFTILLKNLEFPQ